ncbi:unnamed protein product [Amoebophrya sp. A120]|nr:unnamed protein product [Amoebophrya sp. A120]|eukprot:GSA120T00001994001.1
MAEAERGAFGGFKPDVRNPDQFGWKTYEVSELVDGRGVQAHAYTERTVLKYMSEQQDLKPFIARLASAQIVTAASSSSSKNRGGRVGATSSSSSSAGARTNSAASSAATRASTPRGKQPVLVGDDSNSGISLGTKLQLRLERVHGGSLHDALNKRQITVREAMRWSCKLIQALSLLHEKYEISHGDLKPDNIMIDKKTKTPFLIDWGAARWGDNTRKVTVAAGNVSCASPELLKCVSRRTQYNSIKNDQFSLGMILALIWTNVHSQRSMCTALSSEWDQNCEHIPHSKLWEAQNHLIAELEEADFPHLNLVPVFFRKWIVQLVDSDPKVRATASEMLAELRDASIKKFGETLQASEFLLPDYNDEQDDVELTEGDENSRMSVFSSASASAVTKLQEPLDPLPAVSDIVKMWPLQSKRGPKGKLVEGCFTNKATPLQQQKAKSVAKEVIKGMQKMQRLK